ERRGAPEGDRHGGGSFAGPAGGGPLDRRGTGGAIALPSAADPLVQSVTSLEVLEPQRPSVSLTQLPSTTAVRTERDALMALLQAPTIVGRELMLQASGCGFSHPALAAIRDSIGRNLDGFDKPEWVALVQSDVPAEYRSLVEQLAVAPLPERPERQPEVYLRRITSSLIQRHLLRRKEELLGSLQRTDAVAAPEAYRDIQRQLVQLEADRRAILAE
ncbi:MAG: hypothetical protein Q7T71_03130, partial [Herbiconiux sp.]|nr:hypothetical protein [Herbiconiux sp.]